MRRTPLFVASVARWPLVPQTVWSSFWHGGAPPLPVCIRMPIRSFRYRFFINHYRALLFSRRSRFKKNDLLGTARQITYIFQLFWCGHRWQTKVTGVAPGTVTITAAAKDGSGKQAIIKFTVYIPVTSIKLDKTTASMIVGMTFTLKPAIEPSNAINKAVVLSSSNNKVATVTLSGVVKALGFSLSVITCLIFGKRATTNLGLQRSGHSRCGVVLSTLSIQLCTMF